MIIKTNRTKFHLFPSLKSSKCQSTQKLVCTFHCLCFGLFWLPCFGLYCPLSVCIYTNISVDCINRYSDWSVECASGHRCGGDGWSSCAKSWGGWGGCCISSSRRVERGRQDRAWYIECATGKDLCTNGLFYPPLSMTLVTIASVNTTMSVTSIVDRKWWKWQQEVKLL